MRIEESPLILRLVEKNKKAPTIRGRGFLQYDVQRHHYKTLSIVCKVFCGYFLVPGFTKVDQPAFSLTVNFSGSI
jgi:hypothetical protein